MYKEEKVYKSTLDYFNQDRLATQVWMDKYALKNKERKFLELSPKDTQERLIEEFRRIEKQFKNSLNYKEIYNLISNFKYSIPAGSAIFGIGNKYSKTSLGNCFVIGNQRDSYEGILQTDAEQVQLMKRRGGVGHDLSHIRPKGSIVKNAAVTSAGIVPFMHRFSNSTNEVAQDGRRGALMLSLNINHPDVEDFITSKDDLSKITGANISVKVTDEFMQCIKTNEDYPLRFNNSTYSWISTKKLWNKIIHQAWKSAEPGIMFWDTITRESPADCYKHFKSVSSNPCSEVSLSPYDSCRLLSINLYPMVSNPFTTKATLNINKLVEVAYSSQKLLDDLIELEQEKIIAIMEKVSKEYSSTSTGEFRLWAKILGSLEGGRRTGLGFLGMADMLAALNIKYGSDESIKLVEEVTRIIAINSYKSSIDMAKERGAFPAWNLETEKDNPFIQRILSQLDSKYIKRYKKYGRRNIANLAIAPTGSLAIMTQTSSGIEPVFQIQYNRRRRVDKDYPNAVIDKEGNYWEEYTVLHPKFKCYIHLSKDGIIDTGNYRTNLKKWEEGSPYYKSTAKDINPLQKIKIQSVVQKWIDHSISVTYNLPKNTTEKEIDNIYFEAWKQGLKGITIYREDSRAGILFNKKYFESHQAPKRPSILKADIYHPTIKGDQYLVIIGLMEDKPYEIFCFKKNGINITKSFTKGYVKKIKGQSYNLLNILQENVVKDITKYFEKPYEEFATRMISTALRHGADVNFVVEQLNKAGGLIQDYSKVISRTLKKYIKDGLILSNKQCPSCKNKSLIYEDGCKICTICGFSVCD